MTQDKKQILGHVLACGTQIMWGATFVSTKVLLNYFQPVEVLFTRAVLAFIALLTFFPHHLKLKNPKQEFAFAGAGLFGMVLYFMLENTALTMTYASNVGIIVACAPFFVAVAVGIFFKNEKSGKFFLHRLRDRNDRSHSDQYERSEKLQPEPGRRWSCISGDDLMGSIFRSCQKDRRMGLPNYCSDPSNLLLCNTFPDSGIDQAESILGYQPDS